MADCDEVYEVYIRDQEGATYHMPLREGLKQFFSDAGYRLTLNVEGMAITLRRDCVRDTDVEMLDEHLAQMSVECLATIRGLANV